MTLLENKRRIISIDESWLNESDFRRYKWSTKNESNSMIKRTISPNVNLILAMD
jgi:hypothetical protein